MSYDSWLEAPYQERADATDAYVEWCEENDHDPDGDFWDDFEQYSIDRAEDAAMERAEAAAEDAWLDDHGY